MRRMIPLIALLFVVPQSPAGEPKQLIDVADGTHPRQVLDFYQAKSDKPTPVVFYIHGGCWQGGDKKTSPKAFLEGDFGRRHQLPLRQERRRREGSWSETRGQSNNTEVVFEQVQAICRLAQSVGASHVLIFGGNMNSWPDGNALRLFDRCR